MTGKELLDTAIMEVTDVCSKGFGVVVKDTKTQQRVVSFLIHKNTPLPAENTQTFGTEVENQTSVILTVMEQAGDTESQNLADNNEIGDGLLVGFPSNLPVDSPIQITFRLENDGTLKVKGLEPSSNTELNFEVKVKDYNMSEEQVEESKGLIMGQNIS
jgi:molecular chaperone DnaK (HSP70)